MNLIEKYNKLLKKHKNPNSDPVREFVELHKDDEEFVNEVKAILTGKRKTRRELILDTINDLVVNFVHYDRKQDEELPRGSIHEAVENGEITLTEIVRCFREQLKEGLS